MKVFYICYRNFQDPKVARGRYLNDTRRYGRLRLAHSSQLLPQLGGQLFSSSELCRYFHQSELVFKKIDCKAFTPGEITSNRPQVAREHA